MQLTAQFNLKLPNGNFLVLRKLDEELRYKAKIEGFDVEILINPDYLSWHNLYKNSEPKTNEAPYFGHSHIIIIVTNEEDMEPPPPRVENGVTSYEERRKYFDERGPAYRTVAWTALDRTIRYFKYILHNPLLSTPSQYGQDLQNPSWMDNSGQEFKLAGEILVMRPLPSLTTFGVKGLSDDDDAQLESALSNPVEPELHEELLADAQTAIFEGNLRRCALEMAIACEVAVKQAFFARASVAGEAYEFLESSRKVSVSVPELIDGAAKQAFGESFRTVNLSAYASIVNLFQCRNKIAHRGEAWYRESNKGNVRHEIDKDTLAKWWKATEDLLKWLEDCSHKKEPQGSSA